MLDKAAGMTTGRRFLVALSLANLMFLRLWKELLNGKLAYYSKQPPNGLMLGLMLDVLLLAALFWAAAELAERSGSRFLRGLVRWAFFVIVLLTAQWNKQAVFYHAKLGVAGLVLFAALTLAALALFARWRDWIAHAAAVLLLVASPFVAVTFAQGAWLLYQVNARMNFRDLPPAAMRAGYAGPRVVWIIFDELDMRQAFLARDPSVQMPEFDRLRAESLFATNAYPPSRATELSLPALFTGRLVSKGIPLGSDELILNFGEDKTPQRWSREPGIFQDAHDLGMNVALTGWWHPYCRIPGIADQLVRCDWEDGGLLLGEVRRDSGIAVSMLDELLDIPTVTWELRHVPGFVSAGERERAEELQDYQELEPRAVRNAADARLGMVVLHLGVPHPHGIYDRKTGQLSTSEEHGYLDNLALTDRALGEIRAAMETAGVWESSVIVVSADHWWRSDFWSTHFGWAEDDRRALGPPDHRVPFLVKLPGAPAATYEPAFNTVLTRELVLAAVRGEVKDAARAAAWLDAHRTIGESPYSVYRK
jgi:hypothetical protein